MLDQVSNCSVNIEAASAAGATRSDRCCSPRVDRVRLLYSADRVAAPDARARHRRDPGRRRRHHPPEDENELLAAGVARVYTPKDYEIQDIMSDLVAIAAAGYEQAA